MLTLVRWKTVRKLPPLLLIRRCIGHQLCWRGRPPSLLLLLLLTLSHWRWWPSLSSGVKRSHRRRSSWFRKWLAWLRLTLLRWLLMLWGWTRPSFFPHLPRLSLLSWTPMPPRTSRPFWTSRTTRTTRPPRTARPLWHPRTPRPLRTSRILRSPRNARPLWPPRPTRS